jgi:hypothetical protein
MTAGEYWLLETAIDGATPLWFLTHPDIEALVNKTSHGLGIQELSQLLLALVERGDVEIRSDSSEELHLSFAEIVAALRPTGEDDLLYY